MKKTILLLIFLIPLKLFAPVFDNASYNKQIVFSLENILINDNLNILKDSTRKTREEVFNLAEPIIDIYLKRKNYHFYFPNMDSLSYAITCIFVSESSNYKGESARSSLWLTHNNPFGITSGKGKSYRTWEEINGKRVVMNRRFATYQTFSDAIDSLMKNCLLKKSYSTTANSSNVKEFLYNLQKDNYMTDSNWPNFAYNLIYLKCLKKS